MNWKRTICNVFSLNVLNPPMMKNNLNKTANSSVIFGTASLLSNIGILLLWHSSSTAILLLGLLLPTALSLIGIIISVMVLKNISATRNQKKKARVGILLNVFGLILGAILFTWALLSVAVA